MSKRKFPMGQLVATLAVLELMRKENVNLEELFARHVAGDWGCVSEATRADNERAIADGGRLVSIHEAAGRHVWIVTEADRGRTTALLPEEF